MDDKFGTLLDILEKEVELYREFLTLLQRERQYMIDLSLDRLHECNNQKEAVILNLKVLDESRVDVIDSIRNGDQSASPTLSMIIEKAPARYKGGLESCRSNLRSLVGSIREINQINGVLSERAINYTRSSLSFLNRLFHELPVYLSSGQRGQRKRTGRLVSKKG